MQIPLRVEPQDVIEQTHCHSVILFRDCRCRHARVYMLLVAEQSGGEGLSR